jgi:hypothetical protein
MLALVKDSKSSSFVPTDLALRSKQTGMIGCLAVEARRLEASSVPAGDSQNSNGIRISTGYRVSEWLDVEEWQKQGFSGNSLVVDSKELHVGPRPDGSYTGYFASLKKDHGTGQTWKSCQEKFTTITEVFMLPGCRRRDSLATWGTQEGGPQHSAKGLADTNMPLGCMRRLPGYRRAHRCRESMAS